MPIDPQTAENEYRKNPEIKREEILKLMEWVERQPHLPNLPEVDIIVFYHSCSYSFELTKKVIDLNYTLRTVLSVYFKDRDPLVDNHLFHFDVALFAPLEQLTSGGYKVLYCRIVDYDPSHFFFDNIIKSFVMVSDLLQLEHGTFKGFIIAIDMDGVTLAHVGRLPLLTVKRVLYYLQEAMPVRLKGFHFINSPVFMDKILTMMKPFMNKSFKDVLQLHSSPETLYKIIPKEALPSDVGGNFKSFKEIIDDTKQQLKENRLFLITEENRRVNEKLRPGKAKDYGDLVGIQGNFKKLDFD